MLLYLSLLLLATGLLAQTRPLSIYWIDVEGGGATLIVTPAGESVLIDAGEDLDRDAGRIHKMASHAGLKQIDHIVATHWHADHYGGLSRLSKLVALKHFYDHDAVPSNLPEDPSFPRLMPLYKNLTRGQSKALNPGDRIPLKQVPGLPSVTVECVASNRRVVDASNAAENPACRNKKAVRPDDTDNANSIALKLAYGKFTFFDGGDLTRDVEETLVCPVNRVGTVDLYQTDHHGLDLSNNPVLITSLHPRVVVVNNGPKKGAEPETMKTLLSTPGIETVWQIHRNLQSPNARNTSPEFIANDTANCAAQFIQASVRTDGGFSVQIGDSGTRREYHPR